jgi:hypothetical protein
VQPGVARPLQPAGGVRALLVAVVVLGACDSADDLLTGSDCTETVETTYDLDSPAKASTELKIAQCRLDVDACASLCNQVLIDHGQGNQGQVPFDGEPEAPGFFGSFNLFTKCQVSFEGNTTHVDVAFDQFNGGPNCPVFDEAGGGMP